jgi:hypothetical protein
VRNINTTELIESIRKLEQGLSESIIRQCIESLPSEEESKLLDYESGNLRIAEVFMKELSSVKRCKQKLEVMLFQSNFTEFYNAFKLNLAMASNAFRCITKSKQLPILLEIILVVGNYINGSHTKGFRINFLNKVLKLMADYGREGGRYEWVTARCKIFA